MVKISLFSKASRLTLKPNQPSILGLHFETVDSSNHKANFYHTALYQTADGNKVSGKTIPLQAWTGP
jgi:hypothetical protein